MKILLLGNGLLGQHLYKYLAPRHDVVQMGRDFECRLHNDPEVIINALGVTKHRTNDPLEHIKGNALLPHQLAGLAARMGARLLHFSTDCVFDTDAYGLSKRLGEIRDRPHCLTLRTSFIGREPKRKLGLVEWFLAQRGRVPGYTNAMYSGLTAIELARVVDNVITHKRPISGVWNVGGDLISKYNLLLLLKKHYKLDIILDRAAVYNIDRSFDSTQFYHEFNYTPPSWYTMIEELAREYPL